MLAIRVLHDATEVVPEQQRDQVTAILVSGLVRLIGVGPQSRARPASPASVAGHNLSKSAEIGLELPGDTRLSVPAG